MEADDNGMIRLDCNEQEDRWKRPSQVSAVEIV
jgi:hypothetical protein